MSPGDVIVRVDPRYFRLAEVETLLGDPSKAHAKLGWQPTTPFAALVKEMVRSDFQIASSTRSSRSPASRRSNINEAMR